MAALALTALLLPATAGAQPAGRRHSVTPSTLHTTLAALLGAGDELPAGTHLRLAAGDYELNPQVYNDSTCGNCEDPNTPVVATVGLRLSGVGIVVEGVHADSVRIRTRAGYGILFDGCADCRLAHVTLTEGQRDPDPNATDAAVVVKHSTVRVENCRIRDNIGDFATVTKVVVGIIGIAGREGARIEASGNSILRNSWDGIALYRGAQATIENNRIDGVDKARGKQIGGGRGVGIGLTWDSRATVRRNHVTRYWKGIGVFVDAHADVRENVVEDILTWGIAYWDAGSGKPVARIESNVVYGTGACGISLARDRASAPGDPEPGSCRNNVVADTGRNPEYDDGEVYCAQRPIASASMPPGFALDANATFQNRRPQGAESEDTGPEDFAHLAAPLVSELSAVPLFRESLALATLRRALPTLR